MRPQHAISALLSLLLLLASALRLEVATAQPGSGPIRIVIIVSAQSTLRELSAALLRRVFLGEPSEHEGTRLVPLNYGASDPLRQAFDRLALGMSADDAGRYWVDRRIRGQGLPPRSVSSQALLRKVVARLPGALGYVSEEQLDASVRALLLDGRSYRDPGYPLVLHQP